MGLRVGRYPIIEEEAWISCSDSCSRGGTRIAWRMYKDGPKERQRGDQSERDSREGTGRAAGANAAAAGDDSERSRGLPGWLDGRSRTTIDGALTP